MPLTEPQTPGPSGIEQKDARLGTLPIARYGFVVRGRTSRGLRVTAKGYVYARESLYYQARNRAIEAVMNEIPGFMLDDEDATGLTMLKGKRPPRNAIPPAHAE